MKFKYEDEEGDENLEITHIKHYYKFFETIDDVVEFLKGRLEGIDPKGMVGFKLGDKELHIVLAKEKTR